MSFRPIGCGRQLGLRPTGVTHAAARRLTTPHRGRNTDMTVVVGTSGWQYRDWRGRYYAKGVPQNRWFEQIMRDFRTVELNVTFYRLPRVEVFAGWHERSPADAVITVKASRYLTHVKRLRDPQPSVDMLLDRIRPLREKLGPILIQLPPDL